MEVTINLFRKGGDVSLQTLADLPSEIVTEPSTLTWIDVVGGRTSSLERLLAQVGISEGAARALLGSGDLPWASPVEDPVQFALVDAKMTGARDPIGISRLRLVATADIVVTLRDDPPIPLDAVRSTISGQSDVFERGVGYLIYLIVYEMVDRLTRPTDAVDEAVNQVERDLLDAEVAAEKSRLGTRLDSVRADILDLHHQVSYLYKIASRTEEVISALIRVPAPYFSTTDFRNFEAAHAHLTVVKDSLDLDRELVSLMFDAYLAVLNNGMNAVMKKMSSWGAILLGSTLIAGIYGMNFYDMPELRFAYGYPMALGMMLAVTASLYIYFRRKGWL